MSKPAFPWGTYKRSYWGCSFILCDTANAILLVFPIHCRGVNSWEADEETNFAFVHIQRTSKQREKGKKEKMANFILRTAEPRDVADILRLIKVGQMSKKDIWANLLLLVHYL